ncbi:MAG: Sensor protein QseC [Paracidovorax wautersii]|uniref:histidine kinase n=1 Tax=Paracidovorax wautersii TaxID=1177982 RepID=A0A7V8JQS3_9BURK|nr:MAG: Sensor protein QseC [Paracidovorax wautersii]
MKFFKREQRSLFGEILDWMLTPLLVLWPASLALTWLVAQNIASRPFDRALEHNVQDLARQVRLEGDRLALRLAPEAALLRMGHVDQVFFQVRDIRGPLVSGDAAFPAPDGYATQDVGTARLRDGVMQGADVRIAYMWVKPDPFADRLALVQVAETLEKRSALASEIIKGVMLPQFVILPLAVLLVWLALARGIRPLHELEQRIRSRKPDDMSPLDDAIAPLEVAPLVGAVNDLLQRLHRSIETQKRFLADAAHQLKTPLAGLRMQADLAQRADASADDLKQSLKQIGRASIRATHTVNQLLARAESGGRGVPNQRCDLARLTLAVVQDSVPHALERRIDLGYDGLQPGADGGQFMGQPTLIQELVRNLVDNAINYTAPVAQGLRQLAPATPAAPGADRTPPEPGVVTVRVLADPYSGVLLLRVEDNGPGIGRAERALVFQPFYRALGTEADGSGLGLAIVDEIARQHGAQVDIEDARPHPTRPGAAVTVRFAATRGTPLPASGAPPALGE